MYFCRSSIYAAYFCLFFCITSAKALLNVRQIMSQLYQKNMVVVRNMDNVCPHPKVRHARIKRQSQANTILEGEDDLQGLTILNTQRILESFSTEMQNAIFIGYKTATANVNLGSREGPKVLPLGTTLEDLMKSYKIFRTTYTSYIEGWFHRVCHDLPTELRNNERKLIFPEEPNPEKVYPHQKALMKYWVYDQMLDHDFEIFARSTRDRLICLYEAFEDIFFQDVYKPNFVTEKPR